MLVDLAHFHPRLKGLGVLTFEDLMYMPFGKIGHHFILGSMLVTAYGAMVAYLLIIKDTIPVVFGFEDEPGAGGFLEREVSMMVTSVLIMVPLSMQRDMSSLAFTSFISVMADSFLVVFVSAFSPIKESVQEEGGFGQVVKDNWINSGFFIGFGVLTIAMTCQHSAFIVSGSLSNLSSVRWATVTSRSLTISCILCAVLGVCGYLGFLEETKGDILNNFSPDTVQATAARVLLAITMFFTYPMEAFVARHVLMKLFFDGDMDGHITDPNTGQSVLAPKTFGLLNRRHKWTLIIYVATLVPALIIDDLGPVLSITGSIGGCALAYIGPGLAYLGVNGDAFLAFLAAFTDSKNRKPDVAAGDLPVEGDADASIQTPAPSAMPTGPKPWWWYPTLMPVWVRVASTGAKGMQERLTALEQEHGPSSGDTPQSEHLVETIGPCKRDYYISMFFVVFGITAGVAGVLSNVYVQINDIFYTPT
jgi:sodium-coupled neutral amino acid transporter 11